MKRIFKLKNFVFFLSLFSSFHAFAFSSESIKPEFGSVSSHGETLFLACTNFEETCTKYQFYIQKEDNSRAPVGRALTAQQFVDFSKMEDRVKKQIKFLTVKPTPVFLAPISSVQFAYFLLSGKPAAAIGLSFLSVPLDLALLPVTSIGLGIASIATLIRRGKIHKSFKVLIGAHNKKEVKLSEKSFSILKMLVGYLG